MSIIRIAHNRENPYVQLNKAIFNDPEVSLKARGLWATCLSYPDNWQFHISHLATQLKEGKTAIYSAIDELIEAGYVIRFQKRQMAENGKILYDTVEYIFLEFALKGTDRDDFLGKLRKSFPLSVFVNSEKQPLTKNNNNKNTNKNNPPLTPPSKEPKNHSLCEEEDSLKSKTSQEKSHKDNLSNKQENASPPKCELVKKQSLPPKQENASPPEQNPAKITSTENPQSAMQKKDPIREEDLSKAKLLEGLDLSPKQKQRLQKYSIEQLKRAIAIAKTVNIRTTLMHVLMHILKNPDQYDDPKKVITPDNFLKGKVYNGYEFLRDDIGIGFFKSGMMQPYSVKWKEPQFNAKFEALLNKLGLLAA